MLVSPAVLALIAATVFITLLAARIRRQLSLVPSPRLGGPVLGNATAYATDPAAAIRAAEVQCGPVFSIQMLLTQNIWLRSNVLNKFYVNVKEDAWSFGWGMVCCSQTSRASLCQPLYIL